MARLLGSDIRMPAAGVRNDEVAAWAKRLERGIKRRRKEESEWKKNREFVFRDPKRNENVTGDRTEVNKVKSWIEGRMAALAFHNPRVKVRPTDPAGWEPVQMPAVDQQTGQVITDGGAVDPMTGMMSEPQPILRAVPKWRVLENTVNTLISRPSFGTAAAIRRLIQSAHLSMGVLMTGYTADFESLEEEPPAIHSSELPFIQNQKSLHENYMFSNDGVPRFDEEGFLIPRNRLPIAERWFMDWVDPTQMIFDPDGKSDFQTHEWVAYEYLKSMKDVKADKTLSNTAGLVSVGRRKDDLASDDVQEWGTIEAIGDSEDPDDSDEAMVRLFNIFDFRKRRLLVMADGHDKLLRDVPIPEGVDIHGPYSFYRCHEREGEWYPEPPTNGLRIINDWYEKANQQAMAEMRKASDKVLVDKRLFSDEDQRRLVSPLKEVVGVDLSKVPGATLEGAAIALDIPTRQAEYINYSIKISADFDEQAAQPAEARGAVSAKTATQTNVLESRLRTREDYQRGILAETLRDAFTKLVKSIRACANLPIYIEIAGDDGMVMAMDVNPDMLDFDCEIDVEVEDMIPPNKMLDQMNLDRLIGHAVSMPLLFGDEQLTEALFEVFGVRDPRISKGLPKVAAAWMAMQMPQPAAPLPAGEAPGNEADAISQRGSAL